MKKSFIILSMLTLGISINLSAQYTSIKLTAATDTIYLGDSGRKPMTTRVLSFNYEAKTEAAFAQASMDVHHINPFDLPEIYVNGKLIHAHIYFPSLAATAKFNFFKVKGLTDLVVNSPVGNDHAKLSFILTAQDLVAGKNVIRITIGNRSIENLDDFAITNPIIEMRSKTASDSFSDYSK
jgi:hypothetical protein